MKIFNELAGWEKTVCAINIVSIIVSLVAIGISCHVLQTLGAP